MTAFTTIRTTVFSWNTARQHKQSTVVAVTRAAHRFAQVNPRYGQSLFDATFLNLNIDLFAGGLPSAVKLAEAYVDQMGSGISATSREAFVGRMLPVAAQFLRIYTEEVRRV